MLNSSTNFTALKPLYTDLGPEMSYATTGVPKVIASNIAREKESS